MSNPTSANRVAAVKDIAVALLPLTATPLEKALLAAELARLSLYEPEAVAAIWDPAACPAVLLPWLAWALSVDVWDASWPEATKRAVIAAAPMVHRLKGTRKAVQRSLDALGMTTDIVEWWQEEPPGRRGTATVTAYAGQNFGDEVILSERVQRTALAAIRAAKPKSRLINYRVGVGFATSAGLTSAFQSASVFSPSLETVSPMLAAGIDLTAALQDVAFLAPTVETISPMPAASVAVISSLRPIQFLAVTMEAVA